MNYLKTIGFGLLIWAVVFVLVSAFVGYGLDAENIIIRMLTVAAVIVAAVLFSTSLKISSKKDALVTGIIWLVLGLILDAVVSVKFTGWEIFTQWNVILGYLIMLIIPVLTVKSGK